MKVLFITADAYPSVGTTTNLLKKLFFDGGLQAQLDEIAVLTMKRAYLDPDEDVIEGIKVFRTYDWMLFPKEDLKSALNTNWKDTVEGFFSKVRTKLLPKKSAFEGEFVEDVFYKAILRGLKQFHAEKYDILVPVFGNYASIAAVLKFTEGTDQRIVLYQVDPCSTNKAYTNSYEELLAFERTMYERASAVITTPIICDEQKTLLSQDRYQKLTAMEMPIVTKPMVQRAEDFRASVPVCLFSGLIYAGIRDPRYTLQLFAPLLDQEAQLHFVGVRNEELPEEYHALPSVCYGRVPLDRAQELMNGADVLVNIGNLMTNQVPSKIFDYVSLGKPIINICKNRDCPTLPYLEKYPLALNLFEEEGLLEEQQAMLAAFLREHYADRLPFERVAELFAFCTPEYCANQMVEILCNMDCRETADQEGRL